MGYSKHNSKSYVNITHVEHLRKKINSIDIKIVTLIAKRQSYMPAIGKYKKENNLAILQPKRENDILILRKKLARKLGLEPVLVEKIFRLIFANSRNIQHKNK